MMFFCRNKKEILNARISGLFCEKKTEMKKCSAILHESVLGNLTTFFVFGGN
jgi:hypothetical protein